jgi:hypothetical protein
MASIISAGTTSGTALNMAGDTSGVLQLATNGSTTAITIDTSQNVGIGTSSPSAKLDVSAGTNLNLGITQLALDNYSNEGIGITFSRTSSDDDLVALGVVDTSKFGMFSREGIVFATGGATNYSATTEQARITAAGLLQFNSGYGSVETAYGCRAWVNFNGTGTIAIRGSGGVTSLTDNGTGSYTINLTTAMPDTNYAGLISSSGGQAFLLSTGANPNTTTTFRVETSNSAGTLTDATYISVALFR